MEHGFPGTKTSFQAPTATGTSGATYHYNDVFYAQQGYAVVTLSARGFGRSCGVPASRTAGCERGWLHIADHRFENRDTQTLLGRLVDEGVSRADALGVTGISGGGGRSVGLAFLTDRVRLPDGRLVPWRSPARPAAADRRRLPALGLGRPDQRAASQRPARGRPLAFRRAGPLTAGRAQGELDRPALRRRGGGRVPRAAGRRPAGRPHRVAHAHRPGEPFGADVRRIADTLSGYIGGAAGLPGDSAAPLLLEQGWTDDLFGVDEATRALRPPRRRLAAGAGRAAARRPRARARGQLDAGRSGLQRPRRDLPGALPQGRGGRRDDAAGRGAGVPHRLPEGRDGPRARRPLVAGAATRRGRLGGRPPLPAPDLRRRQHGGGAAARHDRRPVPALPRAARARHGGLRARHRAARLHAARRARGPGAGPRSAAAIRSSRRACGTSRAGASGSSPGRAARARQRGRCTGALPAASGRLPFPARAPRPRWSCSAATPRTCRRPTRASASGCATSGCACRPTSGERRVSRPHGPRLGDVHPHLPAPGRRLVLVEEAVGPATGELRLAEMRGGTDRPNG